MSDYLCEELIDEILERLPPKSLLRFRSVSKSWNCRISSPNFIRKHAIRSLTTTHNIIPFTLTTYSNHAYYYSHHRSRFRDEYTRRELAKFTERSFKIFGSCFGVICMRTTIYCNRSVVLWNPSVRRKLTVPDYPCRHSRVFFGFGFDPMTDDYKIVSLCARTSFVYSIKTNSWSEIQIPTTCQFSQVRSFGYFTDRVVHWVVKCERNNIAHCCILTFNLSTHVFDMISLPKPNWWYNKLTSIKDSLALISSDGHETWVWIRRGRNDNVASWSDPSKLKSLGVENCQGYNPFEGVHYRLEVDSDNQYTINMDICGETLELLDKETC